MLDVGWSELLVIAVILIVVVGPKDLPPMLRAFGRMSRKFSAMAGDFRKQFDDALNEADMGDLRKTVSDVQRLNPVNSLREAMNPLRQAADELRADIKKTVDAPAAKPSPEVAPVITMPEPAVSLPDGPPSISVPEAMTLAPGNVTPVTSAAVLAEGLALSPVKEVISVKPKAKAVRKAKEASQALDKPAPAPRASRAKSSNTGADVAVSKPGKKTTTKKDKA